MTFLVWRLRIGARGVGAYDSYPFRSIYRSLHANNVSSLFSCGGWFEFRACRESKAVPWRQPRAWWPPSRARDIFGSFVKVSGSQRNFLCFCCLDDGALLCWKVAPPATIFYSTFEQVVFDQSRWSLWRNFGCPRKFQLSSSMIGIHPPLQYLNLSLPIRM